MLLSTVRSLFLNLPLNISFLNEYMERYFHAFRIEADIFYVHLRAVPDSLIVEEHALFAYSKFHWFHLPFFLVNSQLQEIHDDLQYFRSLCESTSQPAVDFDELKKLADDPQLCDALNNTEDHP